MARDVGYSRGRLVNSFAAEVQKKLGFLVLPVEQCALDHLGLARPRVRADFPPTMSRFS
jgi:hypothetical protein